jgi:hypothetical protein
MNTRSEHHIAVHLLPVDGKKSAETGKQSAAWYLRVEIMSIILF